jgi:hypothetical protein
MAAFRGCIATGDPWDVTAGGVLSTASTAVSINGDTTTVANCLIVAAFSHSTDINSTVQVSGWTNASLASITERIDDSTTSGDVEVPPAGVALKVAAGAYSATTATLVTASNQGRISIALKPPANPSIAAQVSWVEFEVPPAGVAPVVDDFNRANGALGSGWEHVLGASAMVISSNTAIAGASFEQEIERRSEATFPDDQFAQAKIQFTTGANASETGVAVRIDGSGNCYYCRVGDTTITLRKIVAGTDSFITDFSLAHSVSTYYTVKLEVIGNNLIVTENGVERINTNDTSLTTGKPGIYCNGNSDRPALDDFEATAGTAGGSFSITPTATITPTGALAQSVSRNRAYTATITPAGALARVVSRLRAYTATITPTGAYARAITKIRTYTATITPTATLIALRLLVRAFTATITPTGALASVKAALKSFTATITPAATLTKAASIVRTYAATITPGGALARVVSFVKAFTATITPAGLLANVATRLRAYTATITPTGALSAFKVIVRTFTATITPAATFLKISVKSFVGSITPAGALIKTAAFIRVFSASVTPAGALFKTIFKFFTASISAIGTALVGLFGVADQVNVVVGEYRVTEAAVGEYELTETAVGSRQKTYVTTSDETAS